MVQKPAAVAVHTLLGYCVEYDVGKIYDPAYTMVCKLSRRYLPGMSPPSRV